MKIFKRVLMSIGIIVDIIVLIMFIGYIKWGMEMPTTLAGRDMQFMGAYLLAIAYFAIFAILTTIIIIFTIRWVRHGRQNKLK